MKKFTILITASLLLTGAIFTQTMAQEKFDRTAPLVGIKGGVNFSNLYTDDESDSQMLTGFNLGLFAKMPVTRFLAIQPELYFTTKGAEVAYDNLFVNGTARFRLNYIELPMLLVVNITPNFNLQAGAYVSYMISGISTNESTVDLFDFEENIDTRDYNRFEGGLAFGAGLDLGAFSLGARYSYGLTNVGKEQTFMGVSYTVPNATNGVFNVYASIGIN